MHANSAFLNKGKISQIIGRENESTCSNKDIKEIKDLIVDNLYFRFRNKNNIKVSIEEIKCARTKFFVFLSCSIAFIFLTLSNAILLFNNTSYFYGIITCFSF